MALKVMLVLLGLGLLAQTGLAHEHSHDEEDRSDANKDDRKEENEESGFPGTCCPDESWPELKKDNNYVEQGKVERIEDLDIYKVGKGEHCIIFNYDIFGFDSGRTRQTADLFAQRGYQVLIPDYYRGEMRNPATQGSTVRQFLIEKSKWEGGLKEDWEQKIKPYAEEHGCQAYAAIGTCWGTYPVMRLSSYPEFKAGVSMHPSHPAVARLLNEQEEDLYNEIDESSQQLFLPAGNDPETVKKGGLASEILGERLKIEEFNDMIHGWTMRADISVEQNRKEVERALDLAVEFFDKHLK